MRSFFWLSLLLLLLAPPARADKVSEAREHYDTGTAAYALGDYAKAASEYEKAFSLHPGPALLYNSAQAHRLAGNKERALLLYQNYLRIYKNESNADEVRRHIANLQKAIESDHTTQTSPPTSTRPIGGTPPSEPNTSTSPPSEPQTTAPQPAPTSVVAKAPPPEQPLVKKPWFWAVVGGAAVVVAVGVGVGVGVGGQDKNPSPTLGAVSGN
jgi:hypothetical protein